VTEAKTEGWDTNGIIKRYSPQFESFKDSTGREFFKKVSRNGEGVILYVESLLTLYPLPKKEEEKK